MNSLTGIDNHYCDYCETAENAETFILPRKNTRKTGKDRGGNIELEQKKTKFWKFAFLRAICVKMQRARLP